MYTQNDIHKISAASPLVYNNMGWLGDGSHRAGLELSGRLGGSLNPQFMSTDTHFEWKSKLALNFNPWAKFQTFRQLIPPVLLGQFQGRFARPERRWGFRGGTPDYTRYDTVGPKSSRSFGMSTQRVCFWITIQISPYRRMGIWAVAVYFVAQRFVISCHKRHFSTLASFNHVMHAD